MIYEADVTDCSVNFMFTFHVHFHSQVEKVNISLAADGIMSDLKLSASVFALASSLYFVPYGLLPVPCSLLAKRAGVRVGLASMCLAFGLVAMSTAGVRGAASLLAMRLALGASESGVYPFVSYIVSLFFGTSTFAFVFPSLIMRIAFLCVRFSARAREEERT